MGGGYRETHHGRGAARNPAGHRGRVFRLTTALTVALIALPQLAGCVPTEVAKPLAEAGTNVAERSAPRFAEAALKDESLWFRAEATDPVPWELRPSTAEVAPIERNQFLEKLSVYETRIETARDVLNMIYESGDDLDKLFAALTCYGMEQLSHEAATASYSEKGWATFLFDSAEAVAKQGRWSGIGLPILDRVQQWVTLFKLARWSPASAAIFYQACISPAGTRAVTIPTRSPTPRPLAVGDPCVVGRWMTKNTTIHSTTADGYPMNLVGGGGAILTISASGTSLVDFGPSLPWGALVNGNLFEFRLRGRVNSRLHATAPGTLEEIIDSQNVTSQWGLNGQWQAPSAESFTPSTGYSCTSTSLVEITDGVASAFTRG